MQISSCKSSNVEKEPQKVGPCDADEEMLSSVTIKRRVPSLWDIKVRVIHNGSVKNGKGTQ